VPTLLIRGAESTFISPEVWARTKTLRPDMHFVELPDADHYAVEQIPGPIAEEILSFRRREAAAARPA
jgi:pimeloyl-ACP methyl ester carboxylesterase